MHRLYDDKACLANVCVPIFCFPPMTTWRLTMSSSPTSRGGSTCFYDIGNPSFFPFTDDPPPLLHLWLSLSPAMKTWCNWAVTSCARQNSNEGKGTCVPRRSGPWRGCPWRRREGPNRETSDEVVVLGPKWVGANHWFTYSATHSKSKHVTLAPFNRDTCTHYSKDSNTNVFYD